MNRVLLDLKNLQEVDDLTRLTHKIMDEGDAGLAQAVTRLKSFEGELASARAKLEAMRSRHRSLEAEMADLAVKKKNNENRQASIKNQNEYAALTKEAEFLTGRISELEDETLELLDRMEKAEAETGGLETRAGEEAAIYAHSAEEIEKARADNRERLAELGLRREAIAGGLPADQLRRYQEIARIRAGRAVSAAADGLCLACRLGFPPQIFNELRRNEKILTCPNCNRIIYWRDHPDFKTEETPSPCPASK